jgi:Ca-activated chloride channel family protein
MLDTVIILDVSKSMAAEDYHQQSRLAKARSLVRGLFPALPGNRVGMVTFAGNSFRQAELTADLSALDYILQHWIDINTAGLGGSNLVQALETGLALFPDAPQRQQVIFLFSDGGEGNEEFHTVLDKAVQRGIRINTVGLGGLQPARIPQYDAQHRFQGFLRIDGQVVTTSLLEAPLQHIASAAHGTYQRIAPGTSESHILTQAAGVANTMAREEYRLFQPFLLAGLLACGLQGLLARI